MANSPVFYALRRLREVFFPPVTIEPAPAHVVMDRDVDVPMRDGTLLRANVFRPETPGRYPVLISLHPYGKDNLPRPGRPLFMFRVQRQTAPLRLSAWTSWEAPDPAHWVPQGYIVVNCDMRGFFRSEGKAILFSEQEGLDYYDLIEWAAQQPWSSGRIGLSGVSYLCLTQWRAAALNPPSLSAICAWEGFTSLYHDLAYPGGVREDGFVPFWFSKLDKTRLEENLREMQLQHPEYDSYWASREAAIDQIWVPALICGSFSDHNLHTRGSFQAFERISSTHKWLYTHRTGKWAAYYSADGLAWQKRFFDCFLKDIDNGMKEVPPVRLEILDTATTIHQVRAESHWPPADTQPASLVWEQGSCAFPEGKIPFEHRFDQDVEIIGAMQLELLAEASTTLCLFVGLRKIRDGQEVCFEGSYGFGRDLVTRGFKRLQSGSSQIELLPSATLFRRGDILRLELCGRYFHRRHPLLGQFPAGYQVSAPGTLQVTRAELKFRQRHF